MLGRVAASDIGPGTQDYIAAAGLALGASINAVLVGLSVAIVALHSPRLRRFTSPAHVDVAEPVAP
jgi:hypothetical protein